MRKAFRKLRAGERTSQEPKEQVPREAAGSLGATAPTPGPPGVNRICDLCSRMLWFDLPAEDVGSAPHHKSRKALEDSANTCILCRMILRAAISNYRKADRDGSGNRHWRRFAKVKVQDESSVHDMLYIRELGAHPPASKSNSGPGGTFIQNSPANVDFINAIKIPVFAPTKNLGADAPNDEELPNLNELEIGGLTEDLPVWLYGNYWAESGPKYEGDRSHLRLVGIGARFGSSLKPMDAFNSKLGELSLRGSFIGICTSDDNSMFRHIPGRLRELRSDSDTAFRRLAAWLQNCSSNHPMCGSPDPNPKLPTRVIDVSASDRAATLVESEGMSGKYITLSHTWGTSPRLVATKSTVKDLKKGVAISFLPKTFQDAIEITRRLGIKYLWVDCICIIQDDPRDWETESSAMTYIYRNSYLTISASASSDSYSGCFPVRHNDSYVSPSTRSLGYETPREATGPNSYMLGYQHPSQPGKRNPIYLFEEWLPGSETPDPQNMQIGSFGKLFDPIAEQPLSTRAWTLQERLLAPRVVHYAMDQMYFECESELVSECGFKFPNTKFSLGNCLSTQCIPFEEHGLSKSGGVSFIVGKHADNTETPRRRGGWLSLVEDYSKRNLSVAQDKLSAISGVARVIEEETGDHYLAGAWAGHLMEDLFWRVQTHEEHFEDDGKGYARRPVRGKFIGNALRPKEYRAPSWSWASIDAPIKYIPLSYSNLVAHARNCYTTPSGSDRYGRVSGGRMDIEGPIFEVKSYQPKKPWDRHGVPVMIDLEDERGKCIGEIHLDDPNQSLEFPCYALFVDPANAIIVRSKHLERRRDAETGPEWLVPKRIFSVTDLHPNMRKPSRGSTIIWVGGDKNSPDPEKREAKPVQVTAETFKQVIASVGEQSFVNESNHVVRIGVGSFIQDSGDGEEKPPIKHDPNIHGELKLENIRHVEGDQSWGSLTKDDACIPVTIF